MKKIQPNPESKIAGNTFGDAKITRIEPNMQKCGTLVMDGMGTLAEEFEHLHTVLIPLNGLTPFEAAQVVARIAKRPVVLIDDFHAVATDDEQIHEPNAISFEGLTPREVVEAIKKINAQPGEPINLDALMSEFMGY